MIMATVVQIHLISPSLVTRRSVHSPGHKSRERLRTNKMALRGLLVDPKLTPLRSITMRHLVTVTGNVRRSDGRVLDPVDDDEITLSRLGLQKELRVET
jgi:hypothetical protein